MTVGFTTVFLLIYKHLKQVC